MGLLYGIEKSNECNILPINVVNVLSERET